ncbi:MAG: GNAT family N-acetyltransferase [Pseudomonadota bacterium]
MTQHAHETSDGSRAGSRNGFIRDARADDLPALHAINEASTPGVGRVDQAAMEQLFAWASITLVLEAPAPDDGVESALLKPGAFIMVMEDGSPYDGANYRWIAARYPRFAYCDRIAVSPGLRGQQAGARLYVAAIAQLQGRKPVLTCEVNTLPPNPGSMRFHTRLGFEEIGSQTFVPGEKAVAYLALDLS